MPVFDVNEEDDANEQSLHKKTVSATKHQNGSTMRVCIPAKMVDEIGISNREQLICHVTQDKNGVIFEKINNA